MQTKFWNLVLISMVALLSFGASASAETDSLTASSTPTQIQITVKGLSLVSVSSSAVSIEWLANREGAMNIQYDTQGQVRDSGNIVAGKLVGTRDGFMVYQANIDDLQNATTYYYRLLVEDPTTSSRRIVNADFSYLSRFATLTGERDLSKRISYWWGKVNQHSDNGVWKTDPDGVSGANLDKLTYCQKWYPETTSVSEYRLETILDWKAAGNTGSYPGTFMSYRCLKDEQKLPDLVISDFSWLPTDVKTNDSDPYLYVDFTVANYGKSPVSLNGVTYGLYRNQEQQTIGELFAERNQPILDPGQAYTYRRMTTMQDSGIKRMPGTFTLTMKADINNTVVESDENNNSSPKTIIIRGDDSTKKPDLIVDSLHLTLATDQDSGGNSFDSINVKFCTKNVGTKNVDHNQFMMRFVFNGTTFEEQYPGGWSNVGDTYCGGLVYNQRLVNLFKDGANVVVAAIDSNNQIEELREDNNSLTKTIELDLGGQEQKPDLQTKSIQFQKEYQGDKNVIIAEVCNQSAVAILPTEISGTMQVNEVTIGSVYVGGVSANGCYTLAHPISKFGISNSGVYDVKVRVDKGFDPLGRDNVVDESNESNNALTKSLRLGNEPEPKPDFIVEDVFIAQNRNQPEDTRLFAFVKIKNIGGDIQESYSDVWVHDQQSRQTYKLPLSFISFPNGYTLEEQMAEPLKINKNGEYPLKVTFDPNNKINESNEKNNTFTKTINVSRFNDVELLELGLVGDDPAIGAPATFMYKMRNNGKNSVVTNRYIGTSRPAQLNVPSDANVTLPPGKIVEAQFTVIFSEPGQQELKLVLDSQNKLNEVNEVNNAMYLKIVVKPGTSQADLMFENDSSDIPQAQHTVVGGSVGNTIGSLRLVAQNGTVDVRGLMFTSEGYNYGGVDRILERLGLYDGATLITSLVPTSSIVTFNLPSGALQIPQGSQGKSITIKADISGVGQTYPAMGGHGFALLLASGGVNVVDVATGNVISQGSISGSYQGGKYFVFKSLPVISKVSIPGETTPVNGSAVPVYRFTVSANVKGDVGLDKFTFQIEKVQYTLSHFHLIEDPDGFGVEVGSAEAPVGATDFYPIDVPLTTVGYRVVPAGSSKVYELRADVVGKQPASLLKVTLVGEPSERLIESGRNVAEIEQTGDNNFIWTDLHFGMSSSSATNTKEWFNGAGISFPGAPAGLMTTPTTNNQKLVQMPPTEIPASQPYSVGLPTSNEGMLFKVSGKREIYVIQSGERHHIPTMKLFLSYFGDQAKQVKHISASELGQYPLGAPFKVGSLDVDDDGLTLDEELKYQTNPYIDDSDGDGHYDGEEVRKGYNPMLKGK